MQEKSGSPVLAAKAAVGSSATPLKGAVQPRREFRALGHHAYLLEKNQPGVKTTDIDIIGAACTANG